VLIRHLPRESALVSALNDGQPVWSSTEHLLADIWTLLVRANSEKGSVAEEFDHPVRAEISAKAKADAKRSLKVLFEKIKRRREKG